MINPYDRGWDAYFQNVRLCGNPYVGLDSDKEKEWESGWLAAEMEDSMPMSYQETERQRQWD